MSCVHGGVVGKWFRQADVPNDPSLPMVASFPFSDSITGNSVLDVRRRPTIGFSVMVAEGFSVVTSSLIQISVRLNLTIGPIWLEISSTFSGDLFPQNFSCSLNVANYAFFFFRLFFAAVVLEQP